jgi:deazaflavin-dependent oxidoreductase (nitroreductase family)
VQVNPDVVVQYRDRKLKLRARQASEAEKSRLWPICVQHYREYAYYQARTDRSIPVFVCEPRV